MVISVVDSQKSTKVKGTWCHPAIILWSPPSVIHSFHLVFSVLSKLFNSSKHPHLLIVTWSAVTYIPCSRHCGPHSLVVSQEHCSLVHQVGVSTPAFQIYIPWTVSFCVSSSYPILQPTERIVSFLSRRIPHVYYLEIPTPYSLFAGYSGMGKLSATQANNTFPWSIPTELHESVIAVGFLFYQLCRSKYHKGLF